jgi:DNA replication and repair protein RecF
VNPANGVRRLRLQGFRNLEDASLELPPEGLALVGANAQGKTNFLEALHYLEIFRSFRGARDVRLIRFGMPLFRLEGELAGARDGEPSRVAAAVQREGPVKRVTLDGDAPPRIGDALGNVGSVLFTPDDVRLVADGPQERRRFLDIVLSVNVPGYLEALQRYRQVLNQRNAALRDRAPRASVQAWDAMFAESGGRVMAARAAWVREGARVFQAVVAEVSGGERATLAYLPALAGSSDPMAARGSGDAGDAGHDPTGEAAWGEALEHALAASADQERRRATTLVGPHRDELRLRSEPGGQEGTPQGVRDLREYGSGGQKRTAALALRILEAETVLRRRGRPALLLLDDVFAELDAERSERVLGLLDRTAAGQVILTAPKDADIRFRHDRLPRWHISAGRIETGDA